MSTIADSLCRCWLLNDSGTRGSNLFSSSMNPINIIDRSQQGSSGKMSRRKGRVHMEYNSELNRCVHGLTYGVTRGNMYTWKARRTEDCRGRPLSSYQRQKFVVWFLVLFLVLFLVRFLVWPGDGITVWFTDRIVKLLDFFSEGRTYRRLLSGTMLCWSPHNCRLYSHWLPPHCPDHTRLEPAVSLTDTAGMWALPVGRQLVLA
jgi:hypothetical protein